MCEMIPIKPSMHIPNGADFLYAILETHCGTMISVSYKYFILWHVVYILSSGFVKHLQIDAKAQKTISPAD